MQRLSSSLTRFYKRTSPMLWFGFLSLFLVFLIWNWVQPDKFGGERPDGMAVLIPLLMAGFGYVLFRYLIFDLMDEVWLEGDWLMVRNRSAQCRIPLLDVVNVTATSSTSPRRVTVMLRRPSRFGSNFTFMPVASFHLFAAFRPDPVATALTKRVEALRGVDR
ncbi:hypothetical protein ASG87_10540 [Frateuria sp. Soil773]|uniref:hypothetical protein n=1 Tax=Frateuria sp. Soil773 TaxID=1736407 RepID=UPI0006FC6056|nr:hypothetical protein [Frateuria sp. Soil773]KRF01935.1 hypothetical protein ASG87_10540 [Frateuria sp. Soil773]